MHVRTGRRRRARWAPRWAIALLVAVASLAITPIGSAQPALDAELFVGVFDEPTSQAQDIDAKVSAVIEQCMTAQAQPYLVSPTAQFVLDDVTFDEVLDPGLERSFRDILPVLVEPSVFSLDPEQFVDPSLLVPPLIELEVLDLEVVPELALADVLELPRLTDIDVRLRPETEGYAVALVGYELVEAHPNLAIVESLSFDELQDYERALYGVPLSQLPDGDTGGCAEEGLNFLRDEVIPELRERDRQLGDLEQLIFDDPGFSEALVEWRGCVGDSGIPGTEDLGTLDDAVALTQTRFQAAGIDPDRLREAREFEVALATVDFECRARTTDLAAVAVVSREGLPYVSAVEDFRTRLQEES